MDNVIDGRSGKDRSAAVDDAVVRFLDSTTNVEDTYRGMYPRGMVEINIGDYVTQIRDPESPTYLFTGIVQQVSSKQQVSSNLLIVLSLDGACQNTITEGSVVKHHCSAFVSWGISSEDEYPFYHRPSHPSNLALERLLKSESGRRFLSEMTYTKFVEAELLTKITDEIGYSRDRHARTYK
jgi:hypothetical protein